MKTRRGARFAVIAFGLAIAALCVQLFSARNRAPLPPFELSFWWWHSPYAVSTTEQATLERMGVKELFVRAGTFTSDGTNVVLMLPQAYGSGCDRFKTHLVFNFDSGVVRHFESYDLDTMAKQIAPRILAQRKAAIAKGVQVAGVQLDFDCPTRLLPRYGQLMKLLRQRFRDERVGDMKISSTGLLSWLGTWQLDRLCQELDFLCPQAYEGVTGQTVDTMRPVSDGATFSKRADVADRLPCPIYWGLPAYGHAFLFDDKGKLDNIYRGLSPQDALRHPSFALDTAYPADAAGQPATPQTWVGEEILKLKAVRPAPDGRGLGYTLAYTIPTPELAGRSLAHAKQAQTPNCLGAIFYRFPEESDSMTVPLDALEKALGGKAVEPKLLVSADAGMASFDAIDTGTGSVPKEVWLAVQNIGDGGTFVAPDAVRLDIDLDVPGVQDAVPRDFEGVTVGRASESGSMVFTKSYLGPGEKAHIGPIRLLTSKAKQITIRWKLRKSDGFGVVEGSAVLALDPPAKGHR